ncbi:MAG: malto-oligosyltrehalose synthase, partial [Polyangiaceae bacterium]
IDGTAAPTSNHEYLFFQTLVGAWPFAWNEAWNGKDGRAELCERIQLVMLKASKEAKQQTSWTNPNVDYDKALADFIEYAFADDTFMGEVRRFCARIAIPAAVNALSQALIKLCSPGVPDIYQGAELWHQVLVDPDNRRPVDFALRRVMLKTLMDKGDPTPELAHELLNDLGSGQVKLHVTRSALAARRQHPELFRRGDYESLSGGDHLFAFTRGFEKERLVCIAPRLVAGASSKRGGWPIGEAWGDARLLCLHRGNYRNVMTGQKLTLAGEIKVSEALADFPVALFISEP